METGKRAKTDCYKSQKQPQNNPYSTSSSKSQIVRNYSTTVDHDISIDKNGFDVDKQGFFQVLKIEM